MAKLVILQNRFDFEGKNAKLYLFDIQPQNLVDIPKIREFMNLISSYHTKSRAFGAAQTKKPPFGGFLKTKFK